MFKITFLIVLSLSASVSYGGQSQPINVECKKHLLKLSNALLSAEGKSRINVCRGGSEHCELEISPIRQAQSVENYLYFAQYKYGGAYPNYDNFAFFGTAACEIYRIDIKRN